jgi:hypothetical protein
MHNANSSDRSVCPLKTFLGDRLASNRKPCLDAGESCLHRFDGTALCANGCIYSEPGSLPCHYQIRPTESGFLIVVINPPESDDSGPMLVIDYNHPAP